MLFRICQFEKTGIQYQAESVQSQQWCANRRCETGHALALDCNVFMNPHEPDDETEQHLVNPGLFHVLAVEIFWF